MIRLAVAASILALSACTSAPQTQRDLDRIAADFQRETAAREASTPAPREPRDTCGMSQHADLIGVAESDLTPPANARVICFGCAATMDFNLTRLTIQIGADHKVESMRCG